MTPHDVIGRESILIVDRIADKTSLLAMLAHLLAKQADCDPQVLLAAVLRREKLGSTGIGEGVAIPHARLPVVMAPRAVLAILRQPVDFEAIDAHPVDLVVLLALSDASGGVALQALSSLSRCLREPERRTRLRSAADESAAFAALAPKTNAW